MRFLFPLTSPDNRTNGVASDIKLNNIQCTLPDDGDVILRNLIEAEHQHPTPRKIVNDGLTIYASRALAYGNVLGYPILCDLGMSVFGQEQYSDVIQPIPYRAPEVILRMKWKASVDIWNLGVLVCAFWEFHWSCKCLLTFVNKL